jgi:hypothetical protein
MSHTRPLVIDPSSKQYNSCVRKKYFSSRKSALGSMNWIKKLKSKLGAGAAGNMGPETVGLLEVYKCQFCHGWHVGKNNRKEGKGEET